MSWRFKRKLFFVFLAIIIVLFLAFLIYLNFKPIPQSCFDGKKNFDEEGVDCGGSCPPCELRKFVPLKKYETQLLIYPNKTFDLFSLIENPNQKLGLKKIKYQFLIYDKTGILKATTSIKETILLPEEKRFLLELNQTLPNFEIGKVDLKIFEPLKNDWFKVNEKIAPKISVYNQNFVNENDHWYIRLTLYNQSFAFYTDLDVIAFVYDEKNNLIALAEGKFNLNEGEVKEIKLSLPPIAAKPYALITYLQLSVLDLEK